MRFLLLLIVIILAGCCGDDDTLEEGDPVANFVSADPRAHGCAYDITAFYGEIITVTFDNPPRDVSVSAGTVKVVGRKALISGLSLRDPSQ